MLGTVRERHECGRRGVPYRASPNPVRERHETPDEGAPTRVRIRHLRQRLDEPEAPRQRYSRLVLGHHEAATTAISGWFVIGGLSGLAVTLRLYWARLRRR